jgi:hypothetical protein
LILRKAWSSSCCKSASDTSNTLPFSPSEAICWRGQRKAGWGKQQCSTYSKILQEELAEGTRKEEDHSSDFFSKFSPWSLVFWSRGSCPAIAGWMWMAPWYHTNLFWKMGRHYTIAYTMPTQTSAAKP